MKLTGGTVVYLLDKTGQPTKQWGKVVSVIDRINNTISIEWENGLTQKITLRSLTTQEEIDKAQSLAEEEKAKAKAAKATKDDSAGKGPSVGSTVYLISDELPLRKGKVIAPMDAKSLVVVEWDNGELSKKDVSKLLSEKDGLAHQVHLDQEAAKQEEEAAKLEEQFAAVEADVHNKMRQAGKLIKEAAEIAEKAGLHLLGEYGATEEFSDAVDELESAMEKAGWRTSSWYC